MSIASKQPWSSDVAGRAAKVRLVALDVDGVLTDGGIVHADASAGAMESKRFFVRDGLGLRLLLDQGIKVGLITARCSQLVARRAGELKLSFVHQGVRDKRACLAEELQRGRLTFDACAFMGDDLQDLPVLTQVGLATAPADASPEVCERVHWVAPKGGGRGAVRDLAELVLKTQGHWDAIVARYAD
ncbi:MAG: phenylphosphate carboxylase subunit delta [Magnetococcales bacterium]|nr:phenylphosphate carboxylase subunit delta [Magnetococcales bacterium]